MLQIREFFFPHDLFFSDTSKKPFFAIGNNKFEAALKSSII